ncbi:MAG TPA: DUF6504 family protein [Dehalococcoidales bacterium]
MAWQQAMSPQFFSQEIDVTVSGEVKVPTGFRLADRQYVISEILEFWQDHGFGRIPLRRRKWWQRRHRNYYRVKTAEGEIFEIYYDRGTSLEHPERKKWYLTRQL